MHTVHTVNCLLSLSISPYIQTVSSICGDTDKEHETQKRWWSREDTDRPWLKSAIDSWQQCLLHADSKHCHALSHLLVSNLSPEVAQRLNVCYQQVHLAHTVRSAKLQPGGSHCRRHRPRTIFATWTTQTNISRQWHEPVSMSTDSACI